MLESSARRPPRRAGRRSGRHLGACFVSCLVLLAAGCSQQAEKAAPPPRPTPMTSLNTTAMQVPRIDFCSLVPKAAVSDALGGKPDSDTSYGNGDEADLPGVGKEVMHEIGCTWSTDAGATARAWVFAQPVEAAYAHTVVADARQTKGCRVTHGPAYGDPSLTQTCRLPDGSRRVRHAGLFGQTWLSCEVADAQPGADVTQVADRSERWCVEVANTLNTSR